MTAAGLPLLVLGTVSTAVLLRRALVSVTVRGTSMEPAYHDTTGSWCCAAVPRPQATWLSWNGQAPNAYGRGRRSRRGQEPPQSPVGTG
ncbi:hypothetical protein [Streptomyces paromomycinus]|uniref:Uncharacterized protein n=1 Tax=Streptomyces paromomycinus TaxID=92743 RepID=A0A401VTT6_STREY|nr:hypothetical protein [Streptomyces paromomycinus]GCD40504.1 hypothetical protein GKJPGBOP_00153 [Streptomyces paromomycinus]